MGDFTTIAVTRELKSELDKLKKRKQSYIDVITILLDEHKKKQTRWELMEGKVKFFNENKGFGFITGEDGKDIFFHITNFKDQIKRVDKEENVRFDAEQGDRGLKATNIELI